MRILVDMDGVIADYNQEFLQRWRTRYPDKGQNDHQRRFPDRR